MKLHMTCPLDEEHEVTVDVVPVDGVQSVTGCVHAPALEAQQQFCDAAYRQAVEIIRWQGEDAGG